MRYNKAINNATEKITATLTINGYTKECNCEHCGRALQLGVKVEELGIIGADCFVKLMAKNRARFSGNGKPSAKGVKEMAVIAAKGLDYASRMYGYSAKSFVFEAA